VSPQREICRICKSGNLRKNAVICEKQRYTLPCVDFSLVKFDFFAANLIAKNILRICTTGTRQGSPANIRTVATTSPKNLPLISSQEKRLVKTSVLTLRIRERYVPLRFYSAKAGLFSDGNSGRDFYDFLAAHFYSAKAGLFSDGNSGGDFVSLL
jgi:hypothetical protein